jgi:membrane-associated HD superfamily phosphohydrolase
MKHFYQYFFLIIAIILGMGFSPNLLYAQSSNIDIVKLSQIVLYYPNSAMENRINATDLSNYIKDIMKYYNEYLLSKNNKNEASAIIVFAIKPNHIAKIWLVDNYSNSNNIELNNLFMSINTPVVKNGPVVAAIHIGNINILDININNNGIYIPNEWIEIINNSNGQPMTIDEILNIILP